MGVKNERGERVIDTLIRADHKDINLGKETRIFYEISKQGAPTLEQVNAYLANLFAGRTLVAYHAYMKLDDLGLVYPDRVHDAAKMFNGNEVSGQQWQMR